MVNGLMIKLMIRELKKNWFQYLSMFVITVLAVTLFLGFISNTLTFRKRADLYFAESNLAELIVQVKGFEEGDRDFLQSLALSQEAEYRIYSDGSFTRAGQNSDTAKIYVSETDINKPYITDGEAGFLIDKTVANLRGYNVGDTVTAEFTSFAEAFSAYGLGNTFEFEITGFMHSVEGVNIYSNSPVFIAPALLKEKLADKAFERFSALMPSLTRETVENMIESMYPGFENQALLKCENYASVKSEIQEKFGEKEESNLIIVFDRDTMESVALIDGEVTQSLNMIYIFPVIFFLVSILVIMSSISRLILRERINIGTFKALGMSNARIVFHYAFMSAAITFFGCMAGALIGPMIVPAVMSIKYGLTFSMPKLAGVVYSAAWTFGTAAVVCALALFIGIWASRSVIKENPAECMRPKTITYTPRVRKSEGKGKAGSPVALSFRMALRNIRINWGRSLMTVIGVLGCSALLVTSFGIGDTMNSSVENDYVKLFYFDVVSPYEASHGDGFFARLDELQADGTVEFYERETTYVAAAHGSVGTKDISVFVIEENTRLSTAVAGGTTMSEITARTIGVKKGDTVTFTLGSRTAEYTVENIIATSSWNGLFTTENKFEGCYGQENIWVKTSAPDTVRDSLNEVNGTDNAKTMADRVGEIESMIASTNSMKYTLMVFAVLLSVVVLYNLSLLNVKERGRDMATLKVLGFTDFEVALSLVVEILLLTAVGTAIGCVLGYPLMYLVMKLNEVPALAFVYSITAVSYAEAAAVSLGTGVAINAVFGLLISKINMTESLKSVE